MIPKLTQESPNILPRYWCGKCGSLLRSPFLCGEDEATWRFCPMCGESIEYDQAESIHWEDKRCEWCGQTLFQAVPSFPGHYMASSDYIDGPVCRSCMEEHCAQTNCLGCKIGTWPNCRYRWLKDHSPEDETPAQQEESE